MSIPVSYTVEELATYMHATIGPNVAAILGWEAPGSYTEIVTDAVLSYGVEDIAEADNMLKLRAIARMHVWKTVADHTVPFYDLTMPDGIRAERNQIHQQAKGAYLEARKEAMRHGTDYSVGVTSVRYDDPFTHRQVRR